MVDLDCSLLALARCCRQTTRHIGMTEWAQTWLDSARRSCQCPANDNMQVTCHRITPSIKRSGIGHARYIGHASSRFPEIMHRWKPWILFLCNIPYQNCSMPLEPSNHHPISQGEVLQCNWLAQVAKIPKQIWYLIDLNPGARLKNNCNVRVKGWYFICLNTIKNGAYLASKMDWRFKTLRTW